MESLKYPVISKIEPAKVSGIIEKLSFKNNGMRAVISDVKCAECKFSMPRKLIASFKNEEEINLNETLSLSGLLVPLPDKVFPYYYDVEMKNRFNKIGGYISVKKYKKLEAGKSFLNTARQRIIQTFSILEKREEAIATALFLGDKGKMQKEEYALFKKAGLAHVLAISGLHISIISILVFGIFWRFFALFPFSLKYNTKKIAGVIAALGGLLFLALAGLPVSGIRSYIMMLFLFGSFFFRRVNPERSLALAAILILIFFPEELFFPSFQLSFISVLCLIKFYSSPLGKNNKGINFLRGIFFSSAFVSILTIPFAIHHFNYVHLYGIFSNILAIPILTFFIMPFGTFALITDSSFALLCFSYSLKIIFWIAEKVSSLPFSSIFMNYFSGELLIIFTAGLIIALYIKKQTGFILILFSILTYFLTSKAPYLIVNKDYAVIKSGTNYVSLFYIRESFLKEIWEEKLNTKLTPYKKLEKYDFTCQDGICLHPKFTLIYQDSNTYECTGKFLINMVSNNNPCNFEKVITVNQLKENGDTPFVF